MISDFLINLLKLAGALIKMGAIALIVIAVIYGVVRLITHFIKLIFYPHMLDNDCDLTSTNNTNNNITDIDNTNNVNTNSDHFMQPHCTSGEANFSTKPLEDQFPESKFKLYDVVRVCEIEAIVQPSHVVHIKFPDTVRIVRIAKKSIDTSIDSIEPLNIVGIRRFSGIVSLRNIGQPFYYDGFSYTLSSGNQLLEEQLIKEDDPLVETLLKRSKYQVG